MTLGETPLQKLSLSLASNQTMCPGASWDLFVPPLEWPGHRSWAQCRVNEMNQQVHGAQPMEALGMHPTLFSPGSQPLGAFGDGHSASKAAGEVLVRANRVWIVQTEGVTTPVTVIFHSPFT